MTCLSKRVKFDDTGILFQTIIYWLKKFGNNSKRTVPLTILHCKLLLFLNTLYCKDWLILNNFTLYIAKFFFFFCAHIPDLFVSRKAMKGKKDSAQHEV